MWGGGGCISDWAKPKTKWTQGLKINDTDCKPPFILSQNYPKNIIKQRNSEKLPKKVYLKAFAINGAQPFSAGQKLSKFG